MIRRVVAGVLAAVAVVVVIVIATGGDDTYRIHVPLANAAGLKSGSPVVIGGVQRGKVELHLGKGDRLRADLEIDKAVAPIGRNAKVTIAASNFLGQKRVELEKGDVSQPAPDGYTVPARAVTTPTDLDQVLDVLDADTRARATILINEAGAAVVGRKFNLQRLLQEFPRGFVDVTKVTDQLQADNTALRRLVEHSEGFVAKAAQERRALARTIDVVGQTAKTVSARRAALRATLATAPHTLQTLQRFLGELQATTKPLGPAARAISQTAPALTGTLSQVQPFTAAARPALAKAQEVAPSLTKLGRQATPVLRQARTPVSSLATLAGQTPPVSDTLDNSADNIIAILENWSRAIQFRDGLGHVFRGEAGFSPDLFTTMVDRLVRPADKAAAKKQAAAKTQTRAPQQTSQDTKPQLSDKVRRPVQKTIDNIKQLPKVVQDVVKGVLGGTTDSVKKGLDGLLGPNGTGAPKSDQGSKQQSLLDYLLGP